MITHRINGGHIECSSCIKGTKLNISDDQFIVSPINDDPSDGQINTSYEYFDHKIQIIPKSEYVPLEKISFSETSYTINKLENIYPEIIFYPENATNKNLKWESSDLSTVYVCDGDVTGADYGTATVTVTSEDGNFTASCEVTVPKPEAREDKGLRIELKERPYIDNIKFNGQNLEKGKDYFIQYNDETGMYDLILENFGPNN